MRILVVEDETKVAKALQDGLAAEGYEVSDAHTGEDGFFLFNAESFDLVILDLLLPGRSGLEIPAAIRKRGLRRPVLILTAKDAIEDRVTGLDCGADDYLVKPSHSPSSPHGYGHYFGAAASSPRCDSRLTIWRLMSQAVPQPELAIRWN